MDTSRINSKDLSPSERTKPYKVCGGLTTKKKVKEKVSDRAIREKMSIVSHEDSEMENRVKRKCGAAKRLRALGPIQEKPARLKLRKIKGSDIYIYEEITKCAEKSGETGALSSGNKFQIAYLEEPRNRTVHRINNETSAKDGGAR